MPPYLAPRNPIQVFKDSRVGLVPDDNISNLGVLRTRCLEDEALLKAIAETGGNRTLYLLDARPRANAIGNTVKGKGFENVGSYSNCKIEFLGMLLLFLNVCSLNLILHF